MHPIEIERQSSPYPRSQQYPTPLIQSALEMRTGDATPETYHIGRYGPGSCGPYKESHLLSFTSVLMDYVSELRTGSIIFGSRGDWEANVS